MRKTGAMNNQRRETLRVLVENFTGCKTKPVKKPVKFHAQIWAKVGGFTEFTEFTGFYNTNLYIAFRARKSDIECIFTTPNLYKRAIAKKP